MIHFGSPRVGNENFAQFVGTKLATVMRHTHNKDIVPHNPPEMFPFGYRHISGEIFEDKDGQYHECVGNEDKSCADQYTIDVSISDHLVYLDQCMGSECGQCQSQGVMVQTVFKEDAAYQINYESAASFLQ